MRLAVHSLEQLVALAGAVDYREEELGEEVDKDDTLYQRYHRLSKLINEQ